MMTLLLTIMTVVVGWVVANFAFVLTVNVFGGTIGAMVFLATLGLFCGIAVVNIWNEIQRRRS